MKKKIFGILTSLILLTGCAETLALLGPASTSIGGGNVAQSAFSSAVSYGVKKQTGKTPMQHAMAYAEKNNPEKKKSKCVSFLKSTNTEACHLIKKTVSVTREKIIERSKIEDLAKKSIIKRRR